MCIAVAAAVSVRQLVWATREGLGLSRRIRGSGGGRAGSARGQHRQQALRSRGGRRCRRGQRVGAAAAAASLAVSSVGDALGRSGRPRARRALLSRRRPGGGLGRCRALEAGHDAHARELLAQGAHWLGEKSRHGVRQAWCPWAARARVRPQARAAQQQSAIGGRVNRASASFEPMSRPVLPFTHTPPLCAPLHCPT